MDTGAGNGRASIGRVIAARRRQGLGSRALREGIRVARETFGARQIDLEAQAYAKAFYERQGFRQVSNVFVEDGIPHIRMLLNAEKPEGAEG